MGADAKRKEARKRKFNAAASGSLPKSTVNSNEDKAITEGPPKKKRSGQPSVQQDSDSSGLMQGETGDAGHLTNPTDQDPDTAPPKSQRFIVFIGNLPYTATDETIKKHFAKVQPIAVRHRTEKGGGKSKGFAFLEFEGYDRMKTCLKLYHGSSFDDGSSPARNINVELTAGGGGGKSTERRSKLRAKNERLNEQRLRKAQEEEKQKADSVKLSSRGKQGLQDMAKQEASVNDSIQAEVPLNNGDIHPSRRSRVAPSDRNDKI